MTGAPIDASNPDDYVVAEEANSDEAITAVAKAGNDIESDLKEEQNTESYKYTMNIDIENINTIGKMHKLYTKWWRTIYKVIQQYFFDETDIFQGGLIKHCNNNANEIHNRPIEVFKKRVSVEQALYEQVFMIFRKDLKTTEANKNKNEA